MRFKQVILAVVFFFISIVDVLAANEPAGATKVVLDNGLTVIINEMPACPVASVYWWVKTGSANEGKYFASGVTHFVEHMLFKGTKRRGPGVIPDDARKIGGSINASTGYDHTEYHITVPKENFRQGLDIMADMVTKPLFDAKELESEREVILKEMKLIRDKPERYLEDLLRKTVYLVHPYRSNIIGQEPFFKALTREDVFDYYHTFYVPNNMVLSLSGGIKEEEVLPLVKEMFKDLAPRFFPPRNLVQEPEQISPRYKEDVYPTEMVRVVMAYQSVPLLDPDLFALDVLSTAMGGGASSRLYRELYKKLRIVESVEVHSSTPQDRGMFRINATLRADGDIDGFIRATKDQIQLVQEKGLLPEELTKIKRQAEVTRVYERQTAEGLAYQSAAEEAFTGDHLFSEQYLAGLRSVTNEDIKRVAKKYLIDRRLSVVVLKPKKEQEAAKAAASPIVGDIEKEVLSNGLTLLFKVDHTLPILSITASMNAGTRQEDLALEGVSVMTGRLLTTGVPGKDSDTISRIFESRGASVAASMGRNSLTLSMEMLSDDLDMALFYLEAFLKYPTFPVKDLELIRQSMLTDLQQQKDSISYMTSRAAIETLFLTHPFRIDGRGTEETLKKITRQDVVDRYARFFAPNNMVISVFGSFDKDKVRASLLKSFGSLHRREVVLRMETEEPPASVREKKLTLDKQQAMVMMAFRAPTIYDPDKTALQVAVNVLSSPLGGRMFKRIREDLGKAYAVGGGYSPGIDAGMVSFYALTTSENVEKVKEIMKEEIIALKRVLLTDEALLATKTSLKSDQVRSLQYISLQAGVSNVDELLGLGYKNYLAFGERVDGVSKEDVQRVSAKYFDLEHMVVVETLPGKPGDQ